MKTIIVTFVVLLCLAVSAKGQTCTVWVNQTYNTSSASLRDENATPLGFLRAQLPNPELMEPNPCITVTAERSNQYFEIALQTVSPTGNSRLCARIVGMQNKFACGSGTTVYCDNVPTDTNNANFQLEIYCDSSCDISTVAYYYRVTLSPVSDTDDEYWCQNRPRDFPSSLLVVFPTPDVDQPMPGPNSGTAISLSLFLLIAMISMYYIFFN